MTKYERDLISTVDHLIATVNDKFQNSEMDYQDLYELFCLPDEFVLDPEVDLEEDVYERFTRINFVKNDINELHDLLTDSHKRAFMDPILMKTVIGDFKKAISNKMKSIRMAIVK